MSNDPQRIQRALEVYRVTGEPITRLQQVRTPPLAGVEFLEIALAPADRSVLHARIERRFADMWAAGLLDEVRALHERKALTAEHPSMRAVGYRQLWMFLAGQCGLEEAKKRAVAATRQLAKRQMTWLKKRHRALWLDSEHSDPTSVVVDALSKCGFAGWSYA